MTIKAEKKMDYSVDEFFRKVELIYEKREERQTTEKLFSD